MLRRSFTGRPSATKKNAQQSAAAEALRQLAIAVWRENNEAALGWGHLGGRKNLRNGHFWGEKLKNPS